MKSVGQTFPSRNKKKMWNLYNKWYFLSIARIDMLDVWIFHYIYNSLNHVHCYQFDYLFDLSITFFFLSFFWWVVCLVKSLVIWVKLHNWVSDRLIKAKFAHNYTLWRVPVNFYIIPSDIWFCYLVLNRCIKIAIVHDIAEGTNISQNQIPSQVCF